MRSTKGHTGIVQEFGFPGVTYSFFQLKTICFDIRKIKHLIIAFTGFFFFSEGTQEG